MTKLLDVAAGVALLYDSLALFVTTIQELIASVLSARANRLNSVLQQMLTGTVPDAAGAAKPLVQALYEHPLLKNLTNGMDLPSYIPSRAFAVALIDVLRGTKSATEAIGAGALLAGARASVEKVSDPELRLARLAHSHSPRLTQLNRLLRTRLHAQPARMAIRRPLHERLLPAVHEHLEARH